MLKKLWEQIKTKFRKKSHQSSTVNSRKTDTRKPIEITYEKNVIYPNNEYSKERLDIWFDDVIDKHHGGWLPEDADDI